MESTPSASAPASKRTRFSLGPILNSNPQGLSGLFFSTSRESRGSILEGQPSFPLPKTKDSSSSSPFVSVSFHPSRS